jgi:hypothetical protein
MAGIGSTIGRRLGGYLGGFAEKRGLITAGEEMLGHFAGTRGAGTKLLAGYAKSAGLVKSVGSRNLQSAAGTYMAYARGKAFRSMRNHAIVGAAIGGANSYRRGDSVVGGAVRGGILGGAVGGARMGYKALNRIQGTGLYSQIISDYKLMPKIFGKK